MPGDCEQHYRLLFVKAALNLLVQRYVLTSSAMHVMPPSTTTGALKLPAAFLSDVKIRHRHGTQLE